MITAAELALRLGGTQCVIRKFGSDDPPEVWLVKVFGHSMYLWQNHHAAGIARDKRSIIRQANSAPPPPRTPLPLQPSIWI